MVEAQLKKVALKRAQTEAEMAELAGKLEGVEVTLKARAGAKDRLYGSITSADIADELSSSAGLVVDKRKIELEEPIRQLGSYEVAVRFTHDIATVLKVTVVADKVAEEPEGKKEEKKVKTKTRKKAEEKTEAKLEEAEEVIEETEVKLEEADEPTAATEAKVEEAGEKEAEPGE